MNPIAVQNSIFPLQAYEIFLKLIYLKLLQENLNNEIIGFTDKVGEEEAAYYTVTDIQGSITEVYDNDSNLVWKSGYTVFGEIAVKTVAINTVAGAVDAGTKDIITHTIKGESQTFGELANTMFKGALSASLFSSFTQGTIFNGTTTSGQVGNLFTGTMTNFNVNQPQWAGSVGVVGENIIPTMIDIKNNLEGN